jgi:hypothetical protein
MANFTYLASRSAAIFRNYLEFLGFFWNFLQQAPIGDKMSQNEPE